MSTELSNGVIIPEEYSDDWYDEMSINLRKLNDVITAASDNATDIQRLDTDKANQSDLTSLTSRVTQNESDIIALQTAVSGALKREIVQTLPTEDISTTTIYMIRNSESSGTNIYDEYMYINSQWELIGTSATDFSNYYTKNETDNLLSGKVDNSTLGSYYTKTENDNLLSAKANQTDLTSLSGRVTQNETDITALQTAVSGALKREIVQSLPTQDISTTTIYMIRNTTTSGDNIYDEYMYINNLWELIGTSATDFSNYYTKTEIDTLLSGKANNSDVVHKSGDETVGGRKTFDSNTYIYNSDNTATTPSLYLRSSKIEISSQGNTSGDQNLTYLDKNNTSYAYIKGAIQSNGSTVKIRTIAKDSSDNSVINELQILAYTNGNKAVFPSYSNEVDLGVSSYKWKSFNGVEPSSLSLPVFPSQSSWIDISSYITDMTGSVANLYTPPANGYITFSATGNQVQIFSDYGLQSKFSIQSGSIIRGYHPVLKNEPIKIYMLGTSIEFFRFIPCQGNV